MKLAILLPNWLGDLVMATPALRAIRRHLGRDAEIVGILRPKLAGLLDGLDWLDHQWLFDPRASEPELRRVALVRRMRRHRFDVVLLLTNSLDTAFLARVGGAPRRIGYVRYGRGCLLTDKVYPLRAGRKIVPAPCVESYLALAEALGCPHESPRLELAATEDEERLCDQIWHDLDLRTDGRVVALNNSGAYGSAKRWPTQHAGKLARMIAANLDHDVLVICGPGEEDAAREIVGYARHSRVLSLAGQRLGLAATKTCLRRSRLTVSTDSGPRHVAAAFGRPVVTILGPTLPVWIENPTVRGEFVRIDLDCSGCGKRVCPQGHHRCMKELTAEAVYEQVAKILCEEPVHSAT